MTSRFSGIRDAVAQYYSGKLREFQATPRGVDWNSEASQLIRFEMLSSVIDSASAYSILDYGCGYGALLDYLLNRGDSITHYIGYDVAGPMVQEAKARVRDSDIVTDDPSELKKVDYCVASGIFNVKLTCPDRTWLEYVTEMVDHIASLSGRGFAFNMLTKHSDPEYMRGDLYYADPSWMLEYCAQKFSRHVAVLHDYELYEFTVRVKWEVP